MIWYGCGLKCCDIGQRGVVVLIRVMLVVCKIMVEYPDRISDHGEWFEGGRWCVYKERLFGVGGFPFLLSLLVLLYSKASIKLIQLWLLSCPRFPQNQFRASFSDYDITWLLSISPMSDPAHYTRTCSLQHTWCWMYCQHCLTPCFDCVWYYCEVTNSYISICYLCSHDLANLDVLAPF